MIRQVLSALAVVFPRSVVAYPLYITASFLLLDYKNSKKYSYISFFCFILAMCAVIPILHLFSPVSLTSFILEMALFMPILIFASGFGVVGSRARYIKVFRLLNVISFIAGMANLVLENQFPIKLPYIDYLPDEYFGTYGIGGSRIVTIFGFFGICTELFYSNRKEKSQLFLFIAITNFLLPSYILGIVAGALALGVRYVKSPMIISIFAIIIFPAGLYASSRLESSNQMIQNTFGHHPKIIAYLNIPRVMADHPQTSLLGTGLGQFTSTPQGWASPAIRFISINESPKLPGLFPTSYYLEYIEPINRLAFRNVYALSSALNKPYTGISTLVIELGLVLGSLFAILLLKECQRLVRLNPDYITIVVFFVALNAVDVWTDGLWMAYCMLASKGLIGAEGASSD